MIPTAVIVIKLSDGTVGRCQYYREDTSAEAILAELDKTDFGDGLTVLTWRRTASVNDFPHADAFKEAWQDDGNSVTINMSKARELHRNRLRKMRAPIMVNVDIEQKRALVANDRQAVNALEAKLQALRDVTIDPRIDAAQTPEELKAVIPDILK